MMHETTDCNFPDVDIAPEIVDYEYRRGASVTVNISNITTNTISIPSRSILCELQPVTVHEAAMTKMEEPAVKDVLKEIHIDEHHKLDSKQRQQIDDLLEHHRDIFSTADDDIGYCDKIKHRIYFLPGCEAPFKQRHRRIPPDMIDEVRQHLEQLLQAGIIRKSRSPWASNVVLVRKKNGKLRMCVDYRQLNNRCVKDAYALPRIEEVFDILHGSRYFTTIDMKAGYHQVEIEDTHKERTAFTVGPLGFFEYVKMPFGMSTSPSCYQRLMEECLGSLNMTICVIYLDDLIIFSNSFEEHLERLNTVLNRLKECGLKLSQEKCYFIQDKVSFLGHVVSAEGVETDPAKIQKVRD